MEASGRLSLRSTWKNYAITSKDGSVELSEHSVDWIERASLDLWRNTNGTISKENMEAFRSFVLTKYHST